MLLRNEKLLGSEALLRNDLEAEHLTSLFDVSRNTSLVGEADDFTVFCGSEVSYGREVLLRREVSYGREVAAH